jgi:hypothetical protein
MDQYLKASTVVRGQSRRILIGLAIAAVVIAAASIFWMISGRRERAAAESLAEAFRVNDAMVANPIPAGSTSLVFTTEDEKHRKAFEAFEKAAREYPGVNGEIARYEAATHQLHFDAPKAEATLKELSARNSEIGSQSLFALAQRYEATGRHDEAVAEYQKLKTRPGSLPPAAIDLAIARTYEAQGKTKEAADIYFNIAKESRNSGPGTIAATRLTVLDPARVEQLPPPQQANPFGTMR